MTDTSIRRVLWVVLSITMVFFIMTPRSSAQSNSYVVIVNRSNPVSEVTKAELSDLYLKKTTEWSHGAKVAPVDLEKNNRLRIKFSDEVMGRTVSAIGAYWQKLIFSGRGTPPVAVRLDGDVLNYVSANPGGVGYVQSDTYIGGANVKTLRVRN